MVRGTFWDQGLNLRLLHWQADSLPLSQGSPLTLVFKAGLGLFHALMAQRQGCGLCSSVHRIRKCPSPTLFSLEFSPYPSVPFKLYLLVHLTRKMVFLLEF